jgi:putative transposase
MPAEVRYDPRVHHRRSIRLPSWDYREAGAYFVTICTYQKNCLFDDAEFRVIAELVWETVAMSAGGAVDEFVVMPNHVHGIVWITGERCRGELLRIREYIRDNPRLWDEDPENLDSRRSAQPNRKGELFTRSGRRSREETA